MKFLVRQKLSGRPSAAWRAAVAIFVLGLAAPAVADRAANSFVVVDAPGVRAAGDGRIHFSNATSPVPVRVDARVGWRVDGRRSVSFVHRPGERGAFRATSVLGEDEEHIPYEDCVFSCTVVTNHVSAPKIRATVSEEKIVRLYALPETNTEVSVSSAVEVETNGVHVIVTTWHPCPICEATHNPQVVEEYIDTYPTSYGWRAAGAGVVVPASVWAGPMAKGAGQRISFRVVGSNGCSRCVCSAATNSVVDVHELSVSRPDYLGLDRTDAGRASPVVNVAAALVDPAADGTSYSWSDCGICSFTGRTDTAEASYFAPSNDTASAAFLAEPLTVSATVSDGSGHLDSATCTTNFTVVKVDVSIGGAGEGKEESEGAFIPYVADAADGRWTEEGTNALVAVSITCEPRDLPDGEAVTITTPEKSLYVKRSGKYYEMPGKCDFPARLLAGLEFVIHGHEMSGAYKDKEIVAEHLTSHAVDKAKFTVLGRPRLIPDYDRNGKIDSDDESIYDAGLTTFRFWMNDDNDSGNVNESKNDRPGSGSNGQDNKVNGRSDLLDFTPVLLDVSGVFPPGTPDSIRERVSWKLQSSVANAVWTSLSASGAGNFLKTDCGASFGPNLSQNAYEATVDRLAGGKELPDGFAQRMENSGGKGVVMIEGRTSGSFLRLQGYIDESTTPGIEGTLDIEISSVEDMFRFVTLRGAHNNSNFTVHIPGRPRNLMDNCKDLDVFFTHGFNVSEADAHAWGSEVFKRLWQSGSNARFWMFTWSGDYNWLGDAFNGLHYQQDVYQALKTGAALKAFMETAQPTSAKRILMSQSLGNMVACEAMRQGLSVGKYFMFNAAVASEAVDGTLQNANATVKSKYVPPDWNDYDSRSWAANWHKWFNNDATDSRGKMGWPNYFSTALARAGTVYNYYSTGDPIFLESETVPGVTTGIFHWPTLSLSWPFIDFNITAEEGSWQKQETHKGVEPIAGTLRGGWGFNCWYETVGGEPVQMYYTAAQANAMAANGSIMNSPVFSHGGTPLNNRNASQDDIWLSLAKYVPAVSSPVGGSATLNRNNVNLNDVSDVGRPNEWGRDHNVYEESWLHSDMKDMAYFYVYKLYEQLVTRGDMQ